MIFHPSDVGNESQEHHAVVKVWGTLGRQAPGHPLEVKWRTSKARRAEPEEGGALEPFLFLS